MTLTPCKNIIRLHRTNPIVIYITKPQSNITKNNFNRHLIDVFFSSSKRWIDDVNCFLGYRIQYSQSFSYLKFQSIMKVDFDHNFVFRFHSFKTFHQVSENHNQEALWNHLTNYIYNHLAYSNSNMVKLILSSRTVLQSIGKSVVRPSYNFV